MKKELLYFIYKKHSVFCIVFLANLLLFSSLLCFGYPRYSIDTYVYLKKGIFAHCLQSLSCFRFFSALVNVIWFKLGNNPILTPVFHSIIMIIVAVISSTVLTMRVCFLYKDYRSYQTVLTIGGGAIAISIYNPWFLNYLTFPECLFGLSIGLLFCYLSIVSIKSNFNYEWRIFSYVLLILCVAVNQSNLIVFFIFSTLLYNLSLLERREEDIDYNIIQQYAKHLIYIFISLVVYLIIARLLQTYIDMEANARATLSFKSILGNFYYIATHQRSYLKGRGFFKTDILTYCYLGVFLIWLAMVFKLYKDGRRKKTAILIILTSFIAYFSSYFMGIISTSRGFRAMYGLFSVFPLFSITALYIANQFNIKIISYLLGVILLVVLSLNILKTTNMSNDQIAINTKELFMARQYLCQIEQYEKIAKREVKNIKIASDEKPDYIQGENALVVKYALNGLMYFVSGRDFDVSKMDGEDKQLLFKGKEWQTYCAEEQLIFKDDTLYLCTF